MSSRMPRGGLRPCTRSIHWPGRSARAAKFLGAAIERERTRLPHGHGSEEAVVPAVTNSRTPRVIAFSATAGSCADFIFGAAIPDPLWTLPLQAFKAGNKYGRSTAKGFWAMIKVGICGLGYWGPKLLRN